MQIYSSTAASGSPSSLKQLMAPGAGLTNLPLQVPASNCGAPKCMDHLLQVLPVPCLFRLQLRQEVQRVGQVKVVDLRQRRRKPE